MPVVKKSLQHSIFKPVEDYSDVKYFILPVAQVATFKFDECLIDSADTLRKSLDGKFCIINFRTAGDFDDIPAWVTNRPGYTHAEILQEVRGKNWQAEDEV